MTDLTHYLRYFPEFFDGTENIQWVVADHITSIILSVEDRNRNRFIIKDTTFREKPLAHLVSEQLRIWGKPDVYLLPLSVHSTNGRHQKLYTYEQMVSPGRYLADATQTLSLLHNTRVPVVLDPETIVNVYKSRMWTKCIDRVAGTQYEQPVKEHLRAIFDVFPTGSRSRVVACHLDPHPNNLLASQKFIDTDNTDLSLPEIDLGMVKFSHRRFSGVRAAEPWSVVEDIYPGYEYLDHNLIEMVSRVKEMMDATWRWQHHPNSDDAKNRLHIVTTHSDECFV